MRCVLIGPPGTGKSTVGSLLAASLEAPWVDLDEIAGPFYAEVGWTPEVIAEQRRRLGWTAFHAAFEPALAHAVQRCAALHSQAIVSFGAGHSHLTDPSLHAHVARALEGVTVVVLRPSPDMEASVHLLRERCRQTKWTDWHLDGVDWLHRWCTDGLDEQLADAIVYTAGKSPRETADEVSRLRRR